MSAIPQTPPERAPLKYAPGIDHAETAKAVGRLQTCFDGGDFKELYAVVVDAWEPGFPIEFRVGGSGARP